MRKETNIIIITLLLLDLLNGILVSSMIMIKDVNALLPLLFFVLLFVCLSNMRLNKNLFLFHFWNDFLGGRLRGGFLGGFDDRLGLYSQL